MWYLITIFVVVSCILPVRLATDADCGLCTKYGIACVSETDFHVCVAHGSSGIVVSKSVRYSCSEGQICTGLQEVCVARNSSVSTALPLCTDYCDVSHEITSVVGTCPGSLICNTEGPDICIEKCAPFNITCDRELPTSTLRRTPLPVPIPLPTMPPVVTPTATSAPIPQTPWEVCAAKRMAGRFPYHNDSSCTKFVYCRFQGSFLEAVQNNCAVDTYFNQETQLCETIKPRWCI